MSIARVVRVAALQAAPVLLDGAAGRILGRWPMADGALASDP